MWWKVELQAAIEHTTVDPILQCGGNGPQHPPIWMRDYDNGEVFSDDNHQGNFLYIC